MKIKPWHILVMLLISNALTLALASQIFADGFEDGVYIDIDGATFRCSGEITYKPYAEPRTIFCRTAP